jgi:hypothetical protein
VSFPNFDDFGSGESGGDTTNPPPLGYGGPPDLSGFQQDDTSASYEDQASPTDYGGALGYAGPPAPTTTTSDTTYDQPTAQNTAPLGISGVPSSTDYSEPDTTPSRPSRAEQYAPTTGETPAESRQIADATYPIFAQQDQVKQEVRNEGGSLNGEWDDLNKRIDAYNNGDQYDANLEGSLNGELADLRRRTNEYKNRPDSFYNDRFAPLDDALHNTLQSVDARITDTHATDQSNFNQAIGYAGAPRTDWNRAGALGLDLLSQTNPSLTGMGEDASNLNQARGVLAYQQTIPLPDPNNRQDLLAAFQQQYPNSGATAALYNPDGTPNDLAGEYLNRTAQQMEQQRQQWITDNPQQIPDILSPLEHKLVESPYSPYNVSGGVVPTGFINDLGLAALGGGLAAGGATFAGKKAAEDYLIQGAHNDITNTIGALTGWNPGDLAPDSSVFSHPGGALVDVAMAVKNDPLGAATRLRDYITNQPNLSARSAGHRGSSPRRKSSTKTRPRRRGRRACRDSSRRSIRWPGWARGSRRRRSS